MMKQIINEMEVGFLIKNGVLQKILHPGKHKINTRLGEEVIIKEKKGMLRDVNIPYDILKQDAWFAQNTIFECNTYNHISFIYDKGKFSYFTLGSEIKI